MEGKDQTEGNHVAESDAEYSVPCEAGALVGEYTQIGY